MVLVCIRRFVWIYTYPPKHLSADRYIGRCIVRCIDQYIDWYYRPIYWLILDTIYRYIDQSIGRYINQFWSIYRPVECRSSIDWCINRYIDRYLPNEYNNNELYLHGHKWELQHCKSILRITKNKKIKKKIKVIIHLVKYRWSNGEVSLKHQWSSGEVSVSRQIYCPTGV